MHYFSHFYFSKFDPANNKHATSFEVLEFYSKLCSPKCADVEKCSHLFRPLAFLVLLFNTYFFFLSLVMYTQKIVNKQPAN